MVENFLNLVKEIDNQIQEAQRTPSKMNGKRFMPRHIVNKLSKFKNLEIILKVRPKESGMIYSKCRKKKSANQDYFAWQSSSELKDR